VQVFSSRAALACYLMLLLAYLAGAITPPLDGVSAKYADMAIAIHEEGRWAQFMLQSQDYHGGPPLLLWLAALSFELFGVSVVAYKLPALFFSALAVYSTVQLGSLLYNESVGRMAGVILASAFAFLFANNDASMDALLIGSVIFATRQLFIFVTDEHKLSARAHLVVAGAGLALGLAARGLVGVVLPLLAVFLYLIYRLEWRRIFDPFWLVLPLSVLLFASPVLYAYHSQYGMDGLMDLVQWLQSAERSFQLPDDGSRDRFFYYYTYLWAFLPWSVIALWALGTGALRLIKDRYWPRAQGYAVTVGVIACSFIFLTLAQFNLMYYVSVLLPFFALLLAGWLPARLRHPVYKRRLKQVQYVVLALLFNAALVINGWMFPLQDWIFAVVAVALLVLGVWVIPNRLGASKLVIISVGVSVVFWFLTNANLYGTLHEHQAGTVLGKIAMERQLDKEENIYYLDGGGWAASFDVAVGRRVKTLTFDELVARGKPTVLFVTAEGYDIIIERGLSFDTRGQSSNLDISRSGWKLLNPNMRERESRAAYLLEVRPQ
jgi:4-amino-4-deoxy-L-arabinose transferase-like glycosyltransferase